MNGYLYHAAGESNPVSTTKDATGAKEHQKEKLFALSEIFFCSSFASFAVDIGFCFSTLTRNNAPRTSQPFLHPAAR
jgi:hypothetical protein